MTEKSHTACNRQLNAWLVLGNAVFWASAILLAARFNTNSDNMTVTGLLIACWFAAQAFIQRRK